MPVTLQPSSLKYKNQNGEFQSAAALKGEPGVGVPSGGTTGQVLQKASGTDYDTEWTTPSGGDVTDVQVNGVSVLSNGVANVPVATVNSLGVIKPQTNTFRMLNDGTLQIAHASPTIIKAGGSGWAVVAVNNQHISTFYGLAKAAGDTTQSQSSNAVGTYTDSAKSAISQMLNSPVTITGSTPTITALPGVRYVCGEVATLDITLPASGCIDVTFESGSTPTVLSGLDNVRWTGDFDPDNLDANTTYEINIADGLGVAGSWT